MTKNLSPDIQWQYYIKYQDIPIRKPTMTQLKPVTLSQHPPDIHMETNLHQNKDKPNPKTQQLPTSPLRLSNNDCTMAERMGKIIVWRTSSS